MEITEAKTLDLTEILALQHKAFYEEARTNYGGQRIRPLRQTLAELKQEAERSVILKAVQDGIIVGSIRIRLEAGTCFIGGVVVLPSCQNRGIGKRLMQAAEAHFPAARRFELFTGEKSDRNLCFYRKLGYSAFKTAPEDGLVNLVFLEKLVPRHETQSA